MHKTLATIIWILLTLVYGCGKNHDDSQTISVPGKRSITPVNSTSRTTLTKIIVYISPTGTKYHKEGCADLGKNKTALRLENAKKNYLPCKVCNPPK